MEYAKIIFSERSCALAGQAFHVFDRLVDGFRNAGALLAAAREICCAANRQDVTHSALKQVAGRTYRKHGILTAPLCRIEGMKSTATRDGEVSVEECPVVAEAVEKVF